jgi:hypothetical protein
VVAIAALLCCLVILAVAAATGLVFPITRTGGGPGISSVAVGLEQSFTVGDTPELSLDNFSGAVTVSAAEGDQIRVVATKRAGPGNVDRIEILFDHQGATLGIRTRRPATLLAASVEFEISVPPGTRAELRTGSGTVRVEGVQGGVSVDTGTGGIEVSALVGAVDLHTGSGGVDVRDVTGDLVVDSGSGAVSIQGIDGDIEAHTGSGSINAAGATGQVRLDTGSGNLDYEGVPQGECRFETGSGSIVLRLPSELDARVDLDTGSGRIAIDFPVQGQVGTREVQGIIGSGEEASIFAHTGTGNINVAMY